MNHEVNLTVQMHLFLVTTSLATEKIQLQPNLQFKKSQLQPNLKLNSTNHDENLMV
jgi:hypothetical protein